MSIAQDSHISRAARFASRCILAPSEPASHLVAVRPLAELLERRTLLAAYWVTLGADSYASPENQLRVKPQYDADGDGVTDSPVEAESALEAVKQAVEGQYTTYFYSCCAPEPIPHTYTFPQDAGTNYDKAYQINLSEDPATGAASGGIGLEASFADPEAYPEYFDWVDASWGVSADPRAKVWVEATDATASEDGRDPAVFTVRREGGDTSAGLDVYFTMGGEAAASELSTSAYPDGIAEDGMDYTVEGGDPDPDNPGYRKVFFSSGQTSKQVTAKPVNDRVEDGPETLVISLAESRAPAGSPVYAAPATNPGNRPPTTQAVLNGLKLTLTLPADPFAGTPKDASRQTLADLEPQLEDEVAAVRETASAELDTLLMGDPPMVPVVEARATELQNAGHPPELWNRLRAGANKARAKLQPVTYSLDGATGTLTIRLRGLTHEAKEYQRALLNYSATGGVKPTETLDIVDTAGGSATVGLTPTAAGPGRFTVQVVYQDAEGAYLSEITQNLDFTVTQLN